MLEKCNWGIHMATSNSYRASSLNSKVISAAPSVCASDRFATPFAACNFIVNWDGADVHELLDAIKCARRLGDRFIQDKLIEYILAIPMRHPRPEDIPAYVGAPVWAVDRSGCALVGMPGRETIVDAAALRKIRSAASRKNGDTKDSATLPAATVPSIPKNGTDGMFA